VAKRNLGKDKRKGRKWPRRGYKQSFGVHGHSVWFVERYGPGKELYLVIPARRGAPRIQRSLGIGGIRNDHGALDADRMVRVVGAGARLARALREDPAALDTLLEAARQEIGIRTMATSRRAVPSALSLAEERFHSLRVRVEKGLASVEDVQEFAHLAGTLVPSASPAASAGHALSLEVGIDAYFTPGTGVAVKATADLRDRRACVRQLLPELREQVALWDALTFRDVSRALRARVLRARVETPVTEGGLAIYPLQRTLERAVQTLVKISEYLVREQRIAVRLVPDHDWRKQLAKDYRDIFPEVAPVRRLPRVSGEAFRAVFAACADPAFPMDDRLRTLLLTGAERRTGQVLACRRSALVFDTSGVAPTSLRIPGNRVKPAPDIVFDEVQAQCWRTAIESGHLRALERRYRETGVDYPLFPGGETPAAGCAFAVEGPANEPVRKGHMAELLRELIKAHPEWGIDATQTHFGYYAFKRTAADLVKHETVSETTKDAVTGHVDATTRQRIYQATRFDEVDLARAAEARRRIRGY
jgi:integrase